MKSSVGHLELELTDHWTGSDAPDLAFVTETLFKLESIGKSLPDILRAKRGELIVVEGDDHKKLPNDYGGLSFVDGKNLKQMQEDGTLPKNRSTPFEPTPSFGAMKAYRRKNPGDRGYFIDEHILQTGGVRAFPDGKLADKTNLDDYFPPDFVHYGATEHGSEYPIGTRTESGFLATLKHKGVRGAAARSTPYGPLNIGIVTGFDSNGVDKRVIFLEDKTRKDYAISPDFVGITEFSDIPEEVEQAELLRTIVPVYQELKRENGKWVVTREQMLNVDEYGKITTHAYVSNAKSASAQSGKTQKLSFRESGNGMWGPHEFNHIFAQPSKYS